MAGPKFTHLHVHTEYSLLDGLSKIKDLYTYVQEQGMDSLAITDHGVMYGAVDFYKMGKKMGVKPIIGMEGYLVKGDLTKKDKSSEKRYHQLLLAKDNEGYKNLLELTSIAHVQGYYYRPRIDKVTLKKYSKGLIATSTCAQGEIPQALMTGDYDEAKKLLDWYLDIFGEDFYLELQRHEYHKHVEHATHTEIRKELNEMAENEKRVNEGLVKLSKEYSVPLIVTNDAHYIKKEDATAQDALVCVATGKNVDEIKRLRFIDAPAYYITTPEETAELFPDFPEALENTNKIADKCDVSFNLVSDGAQFQFPKFELPEGKTAAEVLTQEANEGMRELYDEITDELQERLDYELGIINDKGYAAYFLIYEDMANWARSRQIPINIRGSVAGSLVSYSLKITSVDPIRFNLPFERFLNPFRPSAPDIDMDIADDMRSQMLEYLVEKYGKEKVAQICTFGRMLPRAAVRDVARVLGYPYEIGDKLSKAIPLGSQGFTMTFDRALEESEELKQMYDSDPNAKRIVDLARQIEGNIRHVSVHAGGVVIAPTKLTDFTPLQLDPSKEKKLITQYDMHAVEDVGLVKLDVLGIRNLSILRESVLRVEKDLDKKIDIWTLPLDDKTTFEMLSRGETMGVFQLSGSGMTKQLVDLQPERIEDIMQMVALYRPGPLAFIPEYIRRKHNPSLVKYLDPRMKSFLESSYGIIVYQDDCLYCAIELAGYDWGEADKFRKAIGKKIPEEMQKQKDKFITGCIDNGMKPEIAKELFSQIETFAAYGFNKAHSASYGYFAYLTAYMKANYPVQYMAALMTAESSDTDKVSQAVIECRRIGINVLPPDVNESDVGFTVVKDGESLDGFAIRFGLSAIKNVGEAAVESIIESRKEGPFMSLMDFFSRVDGRKVNKKVIESLIKVGAFEKFGKRAAILSSVDEIRAKVKPAQTNGQQGLFAEQEKEMIAQPAAISQFISDMPEFSEEEMEQIERELLGFSLSAKPLDEVIGELLPYRSHHSEDFRHTDTLPDKVKVCGIVSEVRVVVTKRSNAEMAFAKLRDEYGEIDLVVFPKIYAQTKEMWIMDNTAMLIAGKVDIREDGTSILIDSVDTIDTVKNLEGKLKISVPDGTTTEKLKDLRTILEDHPGKQKVALLFEGTGNNEIDVPFGISWTKELSVKINQLFELT